ncbi:unnamed protein product [Phytophthora fragariaefolia]|uniref:Unnamed protein product n=1 Tax=Phytophthora fragariaefolia TaxID=1490495 RepID=A0A9W6YHS0_9STRA|nr:unnamed protein product [Phytophthora fragariaefolia]
MMKAIGECYLLMPEHRDAWRCSSSALNRDNDLSQLPPVFVQAGQLDYLLSHAQRLVQKASMIGGASNWELDIHEVMPHVFTSFPGIILPRSKVGIHNMSTFAADRILDGIASNGNSGAKMRSYFREQRQEPSGASYSFFNKDGGYV